MDASRDPHSHGHPHESGQDHTHPYGHEHSDGVRARNKHALVPHGHDHTEAIQTADHASSVGIRAAWLSLGGMGITALLQIFIVWLSGSVALLADTLHNLGHLATTIPLIIAFRLGRRTPTRRYNYGFRRAEDLVGLLIGAVIAASAALIVLESIRALSTQRDMTHLGWVLAAALIGAAGNELVAMYRIRAGRRIGSAALIAEGQHARTDALTSLAVVLGVIGAWMGIPWIDPIVGLVIAAVIVAVLINSMRTVVCRLMDGIDAGTLDLVETPRPRYRVSSRSTGHAPGGAGTDSKPTSTSPSTPPSRSTQGTASPTPSTTSCAGTSHTSNGPPSTSTQPGSTTHTTCSELTQPRPPDSKNQVTDLNSHSWKISELLHSLVSSICANGGQRSCSDARSRKR